MASGIPDRVYAFMDMRADRPDAQKGISTFKGNEFCHCLARIFGQSIDIGKPGLPVFVHKKSLDLFLTQNLGRNVETGKMSSQDIGKALAEVETKAKQVKQYAKDQAGLEIGKNVHVDKDLKAPRDKVFSFLKKLEGDAGIKFDENDMRKFFPKNADGAQTITITSKDFEGMVKNAKEGRAFEDKVFNREEGVYINAIQQLRKSPNEHIATVVPSIEKNEVKIDGGQPKEPAVHKESEKPEPQPAPKPAGHRAPAPQPTVHKESEKSFRMPGSPHRPADDVDALIKGFGAMKPIEPRDPNKAPQGGWKLPASIPSFSLQGDKVVINENKLPSASDSKPDVDLGSLKSASQQPVVGDFEVKLATIAKTPKQAKTPENLKDVARGLTTLGWEKTKSAFDSLSMMDKAKVIFIAGQQSNSGRSKEAVRNDLELAMGQLVAHCATAGVLGEQKEDMASLFKAMESDLGKTKIDYGRGDVQTIKDDFINRLNQYSESQKNMMIDPKTENQNPALFPVVVLSVLQTAKEFGMNAQKFEEGAKGQLTQAGRGGEIEVMNQQLERAKENALANVGEFEADGNEPLERLRGLVREIDINELTIAFQEKPDLRNQIHRQVFEGQKPNVEALQKAISGKKNKEIAGEMNQALSMILGERQLTGADVMLSIEWTKPSVTTAVPKPMSQATEAPKTASTEQVQSKATTPSIQHTRPGWLDQDEPARSAAAYGKLARKLNDADPLVLDSNNSENLHAFVWGLHRNSLKSPGKDAALSTALWSKFNKLPLFQQYLILEIATLKRIASSNAAANHQTMDTTQKKVTERVMENFAKAANTSEANDLKTYFDAEKKAVQKNEKMKENEKVAATQFFDSLITLLQNKK